MEIVIILLLILANGMFAMAEMALISARKPRLQHWTEAGRVDAHVALDLANKPETFLPTVQLGMTAIAILLGAFGERTLSGRLESYLSSIPHLAPHAPTLSLFSVVAVVTYVSVVIGELVPKRLALHGPERIATVLARPMNVIARAGRPFVNLLSYSTNAVLGLFRIHPSREPTITEEEIRVVIEEGAEAGVIEQTEHEMVSRLFRLSDRAVEALMRPRRDIVWLDIDDPIAET
jgi:putative hemolysin